jgi:hypothetical protein
VKRCNGAPDHRFDQLVVRERGQAGLSDNELSSSQYRDAIGNRSNLGKAMGDDGDAQSVAPQPFKAVEKVINLLWREHTRGFIEDDDSGPGQQNLEYLHPLAFADRQVSYGGRRLDGQSVPFDRVVDLRGQRPASKPEAMSLECKRHVLENRQRWD